MNLKRAIGAASVALMLFGCGGGGDTDVPDTTVPETPLTPFVGAVNQADDVAGDLNQRNADLQDQLNNG